MKRHDTWTKYRINAMHYAPDISHGHRLAQSLMGMYAECNELLGAKGPDSIESEAGDVLWYIAEFHGASIDIANERNMELPTFSPANVKRLEGNQHIFGYLAHAQNWCEKLVYQEGRDIKSETSRWFVDIPIKVTQFVKKQMANTPRASSLESILEDNLQKLKERHG